MSKTHRFLVFAVFSTLCLALFLIGCGKKTIQGMVRDPFGNSLDSVTVKISNSAFGVISDKAGYYSIDYAPGTFEVKYSKPGYTTMKNQLSIQQKVRFPADTVILFPIPPEPGIYYVGQKELVTLKQSPLLSSEWNASDYPYKYYGFFMHPGETTIKSGKAIFIDTRPEDVPENVPEELKGYTQYNPAFRLTKANMREEAPENSDRYLLRQIKAGFFVDQRDIYNGTIMDSVSFIGEEKLILRRVILEPAQYAWMATYEPMGGGRWPDKSKDCYNFQVVDSVLVKPESTKTEPGVEKNQEASPKEDPRYAVDRWNSDNDKILNKLLNSPGKFITLKLRYYQDDLFTAISHGSSASEAENARYKVVSFFKDNVVCFDKGKNSYFILWVPTSTYSWVGEIRLNDSDIIQMRDQDGNIFEIKLSDKVIRKISA